MFKTFYILINSPKCLINLIIMNAIKTTLTRILRLTPAKKNNNYSLTVCDNC